MAEGKKSFVLYSDLLQSIEHLTNEEKGILFTHLLEYVNDMNPVLTDRLLLTAWKPIELSLKRDLVKFEEVKKKRSDAGKRSAELRALKNEEQNETNSTSVEDVERSSTNPTDNVSDNVSDINIINEKTRYESYMMQSLEDEIWKETFLIKRQLTSENFPFALKDYNIHLLQQAESKNSLRDYKKHFANWVTKVKQIKSSKNDT